MPIALLSAFLSISCQLSASLQKRDALWLNNNYGKKSVSFLRYKNKLEVVTEKSSFILPARYIEPTKQPNCVEHPITQLIHQAQTKDITLAAN